MKNWAFNLLIDKNESDAKQIIQDLKDKNFNVKNSNPPLTVYANIAEPLIEELITFFDSSKDYKSQTNHFKLLFISVLSDLPEKDYKTLCSLKYCQFVFRVVPAFIRNIEIKNNNNTKEIKVVFFSNEFCFLPWEVGRAIVAHEFAHIIKSLGGGEENEAKVNKTVRNWGFNIEQDYANKYENRLDRNKVGDFRQFCEALNAIY